MKEQEILSKANIFIESQGFHLMTRKDIPRFLECDTEAYGGIRMALKLGLPAMRRIMHYEDYSASVRLNATGGREWYWYNLVVRPEAQGQHLVGKLLRPMLDYCAQNGRPAYLETHWGMEN